MHAEHCLADEPTMLARQDQLGEASQGCGNYKTLQRHCLPKGGGQWSTLPGCVSLDRSLLRRTYLYSDGIPLQLQSADRVL